MTGKCKPLIPSIHLNTVLYRWVKRDIEIRQLFVIRFFGLFIVDLVFVEISEMKGPLMEIQ